MSNSVIFPTTTWQKVLEVFEFCHELVGEGTTTWQK
jgi:hypothetical protein